MLESFVGRLIERRTFPGVSILAGAGGKILYERCFGLRAKAPLACACLMRRWGARLVFSSRSFLA